MRKNLYLIASVLVLSLALSNTALAVIDGGGTTGKIPKFTAPTVIGDSVITEKLGKIGIGTNNPQEVLDVVGGSFFRGNSSRSMFLAKQNGTGDVATFMQGSNYSLIIKNNGNVGIGTDNPAERLQVGGTIHSASGGFKFPDGTIQITAADTSGWKWSGNGRGVNWIPRDSNRSWTGVAVSSDGRYQTAGDYGGKIYTSQDYGVTWTPRDSDRYWHDGVAMSSDGSYQTASVQAGGKIYTSSDYGASWTPRESNRDWFGVAMSSDGRYQTAVAAGGQIYTSSDYGASWTPRESNRKWRGVAMSSDGSYQTATVQDSGQIYTSSDYGASWASRDSNRNWWGVAMSSDGSYQTAVVWGGQIYTSSDYGAS